MRHTPHRPPPHTLLALTAAALTAASLAAQEPTLQEDLRAIAQAPAPGQDQAFQETLMRIARRGRAATSAIPRLVELLDEGRGIGMTASKALAWIGPACLGPVFERLRSLELTKLMGHPTWWTLMRMRDGASPILPSMRDHLRGKGKNGYGTHLYIEYLRICGPAGHAELGGLITDPRHGPHALRELSASAQAGKPGAVTMIFQALDNAKIRRQCMTELQHLSRRKDRHAPTWVSAASAHLKSEDSKVRALCAETLAELGAASRVARTPLIEALSDTDNEVWIPAARALANCLSIAELTRLANETRNARGRTRATIALGYAGPKAKRALLELLSNDTEGVRFASATALYRIGADCVAELTERLNKDAGKGTRATLHALARIGAKSSQALPRIRELAESKDAAIARAARRAEQRITGVAR